ncbi:CYTH domain-containing protein, partial [Candidatus Saccharibacteria bacterium]|nr:CYTH domain-containing protein [Candidatus Saccharibacteria bacterium]
TTEYEAKFLNINIDDIRRRLQDLGATLEKPMRLMRRVTIDTDELKKKDAFIRVRDEGDRVTITYKQFDSLSVEGAKEHEIIVSDFDEAVALLAAAGLPHRSFQESKRETWMYGDVEIVIDEWPWLNSYIEVEAGSADEVKDAAEALGFNWSEAVFGDVMAAYRVQYPHLSEKDTVGNIPEVKFGDPLPKLLKG